MTNKPWQEKEEFGFSFPFRCWESELKDFIYPSHWHEYYEIFLVLQGKVNIVIDGDARDVQEGDIVLLDPGRVHGFPSSEAQTCLRIFHFAQSFFAKEDHLLALGDYRAVFIQKPILHAFSHPEEGNSDELLYTHIASILDLLFNEYKKKKLGWQIAIKGELYRMFLFYVRNIIMEDTDKFPAGQLPVTTEERIERVFLFVNEHFQNTDLDLNHAAAEADVFMLFFLRCV